MEQITTSTLQRLFDLYNYLEQDKLSFIYNGEVSDDITEGVLRISDYNLTHLEEMADLKNRVNFIMVECFQNIVRHGKSPLTGIRAPTGLFSTRVVGESNFISSVNMIELDAIDSLRQKLSQINKLGKDKLKALYLDVLRNKAFNNKGGAGLGLIEIARKSGVPIGYDFENVNDTFSNFYLSIKLSPPTLQPSANSGNDAIRYTKEFDGRIRESNVVLVYKGDFGKDSIMPIINILEDKMRDEAASKSFYLVLVEMLQNVSRHAINLFTREGILMIQDLDGGFLISVGNVVNDESKQVLEHRFAELNAMDEEELKAHYKQTLRNGGFGDRGGAGLGLIEIARKVHRPMEAQFDQVSPGNHFFTFNVNI